MPEAQKLNLVIADTDTQYLKGFYSYTRRFTAARFNITALSSETEIVRYIEDSPKKPDVILTSKYFHELFRNYKETPVILLDEGREYNCSIGNATIDKYQSGEILLCNVLDIYADRSDYRLNKNVLRQSSKESRAICVYSPQGGTGKTSISVNLAIQLGQMGYSVFYLNIESVCSTGSFFDVNSSFNFSHIIYYLKCNRSSLPFKIKLVQKTDLSGKVSYFPPPANSLEMEDLTSDDAEFLVRTLKETEEYDFIIIDMDSAWNKLNAAVLGICDQKLLIVNEDPLSQEKFNLLLESIKSLTVKNPIADSEEVIVINNKCSNNENDRLLNKTYPVRFSIPEFNHLLSEADGRLSVSFNLYFNHEINRLGKELLEWRNYVPLSGS